MSDLFRHPIVGGKRTLTYFHVISGLVSEKTLILHRFSNRAAVAHEPSSGFRAVFRGANTNNGGNAGCGAVNVNNAPTNANANIGSPLNNE